MFKDLCHFSLNVLQFLLNIAYYSISIFIGPLQILLRSTAGIRHIHLR